MLFHLTGRQIYGENLRYLVSGAKFGLIWTIYSAPGSLAGLIWPIWANLAIYLNMAIYPVFGPSDPNSEPGSQ